MSELLERDEDEIVDLDTCSQKKSIALAAAITAVLGFVGYSYLFLCIHFVIGGLAAAGHFAKRFGITISIFTGVKMGAISSFLGMLITFVAFPLWALPSITDEEWAKLREEFIRQAYESGQPEAAEVGERIFVSDNATMFLVGIFIAGTVLSLVLGSLGGMLGATFFKKGPEAK
ncbi:hypothetical protein [Pelagicoccus albus]|uniref:DUF4199 domain-containing protein n=1 Tax=Pelagicoccus albus TaxID=415222 RepID=A0A7X1B8I3_9BACT|nr:hypothetical protein [Pelagicoccus albus]MBC2606358.1 hypothetical protein [Pelagicoccus albus]